MDREVGRRRAAGSPAPGYLGSKGLGSPVDRARGQHRQAGDQTLLPGCGDPGLAGPAPGPAGRRAYPCRSPPVPSRAGRGGPGGGAEGRGHQSLSQACASSRATDPGLCDFQRLATPFHSLRCHQSHKPRGVSHTPFLSHAHLHPRSRRPAGSLESLLDGRTAELAPRKKVHGVENREGEKKQLGTRSPTAVSPSPVGEDPGRPESLK